MWISSLTSCSSNSSKEHSGLNVSKGIAGMFGMIRTIFRHDALDHSLTCQPTPPRAETRASSFHPQTWLTTSFSHFWTVSYCNCHHKQKTLIPVYILLYIKLINSSRRCNHKSNCIMITGQVIWSSIENHKHFSGQMCRKVTMGIFHSHC